MEHMSKRELEDLQVKKEAEYREGMKALSVVEIEDHQLDKQIIELRRQILDLQIKRKELADAITKAKYNLRLISSTLRDVKTLIYQRLAGE